MNRRLVWLLILPILCQCATKHQPVEFVPYYPLRPESQFSSLQLWEMRELESRESLSKFERKRLWDLYQVELRSLKPQTARFLEVDSAAKKLESDVRGLEEDVQDLQKDVAKHREVAPPNSNNLITTKSLRREYQKAYQLWNKDQNEAAFKRVGDILKSATLKDKASVEEWYRVWHLRLRVGLEIGKFDDAEEAFRVLKGMQDCSTDTAQASFLLSLHLFAVKQAKRARELLDGQCDPDQSPSNQIKRTYWKARFLEGTGEESAKLYDHLMSLKMPGYYSYLVRVRLGKSIELPKFEAGEQAYLNQEMTLPGKIAGYLESAEDRLRANLRKDAGVYLSRASQLLREEVNEKTILPLLYTAHLLRASGNHLESMRIYSSVTSALQEDSPTLASLELSFLSEMFPRPFAPAVEWMSRVWGADPDFLYAIMRQESAFNPGAVSPTDARGLMQLMPFLAKNLSERWNYQQYYSDKLLFHAEENLKLATFHLYQLRALVPHMALIAASYNAGLSRVRGWWKKYGSHPLDVFVELIPVNETRNYVKLVMRNYLFYRALRTNGALEPGVIPFQLPPYPQSVSSAHGR